MQTYPTAGNNRIHDEDAGGAAHHIIEVADQTLTYRQVRIEDRTPTGAQLAVAAGFKSVDDVSVLQVLPDGELEDVRPTETVDLPRTERRFVIIESDRAYRLTIDDQRFDWPCRIVSGGLLRKLGQVPADRVIYFERYDQPDRLLGEHDLVDLNAAGVEAFVSRKRSWKLNVQGVLLELPAPTIVVREALVLAGFNPDQGWQIFLKVAGQPKQPVQLTTEIDLRTPGIEKLRLTPKDVNNGEGPANPCRAFALLDIDEAHLDRLGLRWETIIEANRRWLLLHDYPLPAGYTVTDTKLALEIPPTYPGAQIYGFYGYPPLALACGRTIQSTQLRGVLLGVEYHGWSRYRGPAAPWNPATDNVATQLALVDAALAKEVGE
ncbi:multiubiquitin domain-containing protein [Paraburkholderia sediminicola]|uniref:multiubiquitin domain-containing protein n=1 Tax=Paraburkholderia sediminicola TaxID=458836 RepID=UPI0038B887CB